MLMRCGIDINQISRTFNDASRAWSTTTIAYELRSLKNTWLETSWRGASWWL